MSKQYTSPVLVLHGKVASLTALSILKCTPGTDDVLGTEYISQDPDAVCPDSD